MAISKTVFTSTAWGGGLGTEVYNWLQANGSAYFDEIKLESSAVRLYIDGTQVWDCSANGIYYKKYGANCYMSYVAYTHGYVLDSGILLVRQSTDNNKGCMVYFGKSSAGNTCTIAMGKPGYSQMGRTDTMGIFSADFVASATHDYWAGGNTISGSSTENLDRTIDYVCQSGMTTLTPIVMPGDVYCPTAFIQTFNEYRGIIGIFKIGNEEYFSNGYCAFK